MSVLPATAQTPPSNAWESKPVDKWDKKDVADILRDSAWSTTARIRPGAKTPVGNITGDHTAYVMLRSSLVVRLALVRSAQIEQNYDSMNAADQKKFDLANRSTLTCELCDKYYIVSVRAATDMLRNAVAIKGRSKEIYLSNEKGERRTLERFSPAPALMGEALFYFPRFDEKGQPLLTKDNTKLVFNFEGDPLGGFNESEVLTAFRRVEFKVQDIVREGIVVF